ncbi:MAG: hypothetical protein H0W64_02755 [Gammaproteobacteria bacterium]|nr:hypothetical protein [Gammaproteobacteria bacterium]
MFSWVAGKLITKVKNDVTTTVKNGSNFIADETKNLTTDTYHYFSHLGTKPTNHQKYEQLKQFEAIKARHEARKAIEESKRLRDHKIQADLLQDFKVSLASELKVIESEINTLKKSNLSRLFSPTLTSRNAAKEILENLLSSKSLAELVERAKLHQTNKYGTKAYNSKVASLLGNIVTQSSTLKVNGDQRLGL